MRYIQPEARRQEEKKEKTRIKNGQFNYANEGVDYWITSGANLRGEFPYLRKGYNNEKNLKWWEQ